MLLVPRDALLLAVGEEVIRDARRQHAVELKSVLHSPHVEVVEIPIG